MADFLTNLDNLHDHLASTYPGMRAPSFRVMPGPNGEILLHYYSDRKALHPIVLGIVKVVGKEFFGTEVTAKISEVSEFGDRAHVILEITEANKEGKSNLLPSTAADTLSNRPDDLPIGVKTMCAAFPFHVVFTKNFSIVQAGKGLLRITSHLWRQAKRGKPLKFNDLFEITRPVIDCTFESIRSYCNQVFVIQTRENVLQPEQGPHPNGVQDLELGLPLLRLKGQMVPVDETNCILFLCSPRVKDIDDMQRIGLYFSDLAIHDPARELFLRSHHHRGERELVEKLDEATNRLKMLQSKLDEDKKITEDLLHSILPSKVAKLLCQNLPVPAEKFETVSCLFSDIVGFTNMCGSCAPMDIVRLLNKLYLQFDHLSGIHGVYKVETIGDAYVVVAGVPEHVDDHADRLISMGLDMVAATDTVQNPVTGGSIKMRIGIHTGYVTAGVVGMTMPRYCLFGNTVTVANKTESLSKPSRVNITEVTKSHLIRHDYAFEENLDIGDFPHKCFLVDIVSDRRNNRLVGRTLLRETAKASEEDSMLLSPSSSPERKNTNRASTSFEPQIEEEFSGNAEAPTQAALLPKEPDRSPLFQPRNAIDATAQFAATNNTSPEEQEHASTKASFLNVKWRASQAARQKSKNDKKNGSFENADSEPQSARESSLELSRLQQESPEPKPSRLQCPFFRFRSKTTTEEPGHPSNSKVIPVVAAVPQVQEVKKNDGKKKEKFWSRVIFPS
ncbi:guanylate cyclase soluble subunit beta-1-like isoform X2 [Ornithodoros turicata]